MKTQSILVYARLIICEAQKHRGSSLLDYDRFFLQQAAINYIQVSWQQMCSRPVHVLQSL